MSTEIGIKPLQEPDHGVYVGSQLIAICPDWDRAELVAAGLLIIKSASRIAVGMEQPAEQRGIYARMSGRAPVIGTHPLE